MNFKKIIGIVIIILISTFIFYRGYNGFRNLEEKTYCGKITHKAEITGGKYSEEVIIVDFEFGTKEIYPTAADFLKSKVGNTVCYSFSKMQIIKDNRVIEFVDFFILVILAFIGGCIAILLTLDLFCKLLKWLLFD